MHSWRGGTEIGSALDAGSLTQGLPAFVFSLRVTDNIVAVPHVATRARHSAETDGGIASMAIVVRSRTSRSLIMRL